jgi:hypothetical protein
MINFASGIKALFGRGFSFWDTDMDANLRKISDHLGNIKCAGAPGTAIVGVPTLGVAYLESDGSYVVYDLNAASATVSASYPARKGLIACDGENIYNNTGSAWLNSAGITNNAIATANNALAAANDALAKLAAIASDSILSPNEKHELILRVAAINGERIGIDNSAAALQVTTEKLTYDNAVIALNVYLATLTSAVLWSDTGGDTTIARLVFNQKFIDVFSTKQALLNKIAAQAALRADTGFLTGLIDTPQIAPNAATEIYKTSVTTANYAKQTLTQNTFLYAAMLTYSPPVKDYAYTLKTITTFSYQCIETAASSDSIVTAIINRSLSGYDNSSVSVKLTKNTTDGNYSGTVISTSDVAANDLVTVIIQPNLAVFNPVANVYFNDAYNFSGISTSIEINKR